MPVNNSHTASDAEELDSVFRFQLANDRRDFFDRISERLCLGDLGADMHLHANNLNVAHFCSSPVNRSNLIERNAELVLTRAGRDVLVRMWIYVRVDAQGNRCADSLCACNAIDIFELRFALDIETIDSLFERIPDFLLRLSHAGKCAFAWIATRCKHAKQLAARNNVKT